MLQPFANWSGSVRFAARQRRQANSTEEVRQIVCAAAESGWTVRPVGAGHSSSALVVTTDVLLSLDRLTGVVDHAVDRCRVKVLPGTRVGDAAAAFADIGLAMPNMGDVDLQAIAGALSTGTHGSGVTLKNLSAMLVGGEMVAGSGMVVRFGEDVDAGGARLPGVAQDELLRAVRVSLGALGILTSLTLELVPAYELHRQDWCTDIDWAIGNYDELAQLNRSFDMYWYPRSDRVQVRTLNPPGSEPALTPPGARIHAEEHGPSHDIIPRHRSLRFDEMEYMLPYEVGLDCFARIRARIKERHRRTVAWRVLVRTVASDDAMLSNCYGRPTMTIALLHNAGLPYQEYFSDIEPILQSFGGRPHWGKKHSMTAAQLRPLFPEWEICQRLRRTLDPAGVLMNDHLRDLLEDRG